LNLKVVTTYAKALVETLAQKPNRIIFNGKPATLTPESEILRSSKTAAGPETVILILGGAAGGVRQFSVTPHQFEKTKRVAQRR